VKKKIGKTFGELDKFVQKMDNVRERVDALQSWRIISKS